VSAGLPAGATPAPSAARRRELSAHGRRSPSPRTRRRSVDTCLNAPLGPLRLIYRNAGGHRGVPIAREDSLRDFHGTRVGQRADSALFGWQVCSLTPAEGPSLGDRVSNRARVASRRGSACRIAE